MLRKLLVSALFLGGFTGFSLPAGLAHIHSVEFWFEFQGVPLDKKDQDGGLLVCAGERRIVGEVLPSVVGYFADIQSCSANYSGVFGNTPQPTVCDEIRLNECMG